MSTNGNLNKANAAKNDEFYTRLEDIENELRYYKHHFLNKIVYCNCDDPTKSKFFEYFRDNFHHLHLKKLITTHHSMTDAYKSELFPNGNFKKIPLTWFGCFDQCDTTAALMEADIVVTNPPFSRFRDYVDLMINQKKQFLIVGPIIALKYPGVFPHIKNGTIKIGMNRIREFEDPNGAIVLGSYSGWFTTLTPNAEKPKWRLTEKYDPLKYPKYDNYTAIHVKKSREIPNDYYEEIGVPITFLEKWNEHQFEIIGKSRIDNVPDVYLGGKWLFDRVLIKRKK